MSNRRQRLMHATYLGPAPSSAVYFGLTVLGLDRSKMRGTCLDSQQWQWQARPKTDMRIETDRSCSCLGRSRANLCTDQVPGSDAHEICSIAIDLSLIIYSISSHTLFSLHSLSFIPRSSFSFCFTYSNSHFSHHAVLKTRSARCKSIHLRKASHSS